jgi:hypothetical protein
VGGMSGLVEGKRKGEQQQEEDSLMDLISGAARNKKQ